MKWILYRKCLVSHRQSNIHIKCDINANFSFFVQYFDADFSASHFYFSFYTGYRNWPCNLDLLVQNHSLFSTNARPNFCFISFPLLSHYTLFIFHFSSDIIKHLQNAEPTAAIPMKTYYNRISMQFRWFLWLKFHPLSLSIFFFQLLWTWITFVSSSSFQSSTHNIFSNNCIRGKALKAQKVCLLRVLMYWQ